MGAKLLMIKAKVEMQNALGSAKVITGISKASEAVITATHDYAIGDYAIVKAVSGMVQINDRVVRAKTVSGTASFVAEGLDSTGFSNYGSGGTVEEITSWHAFDNLTTFSYPEPTPNSLDATTIHDENKVEIFGLDDAPTISCDGFSDPLGTTTAALRAASAAKTPRAFRLTLLNGNIMVFYAYVSGGRGLDGAAGAIAGSKMQFKLLTPEQYFAS